jgi:hypothetical protein
VHFLSPVPLFDSQVLVAIFFSFCVHIDTLFFTLNTPLRLARPSPPFLPHYIKHILPSPLRPPQPKCPSKLN